MPFAFIITAVGLGIACAAWRARIVDNRPGVSGARCFAFVKACALRE
jgi:hypothetical protein